MNIIIIGLIFLFQILVFLCFGSLFVHFFKQTHNSIFFSLSCGFFINFALFELFALPCTLLRLPLTFLAVIWMAFSCIIVLLAIYFCRRDWKSAIMCSPQIFPRKHMDATYIICKYTDSDADCFHSYGQQCGCQLLCWKSSN